MVTIIYYPDPMGESETHECETVFDFLQPRFKTRDELLDLRVFDGEILGHEVDQSDGEFLFINEGVIAITHDSMIPRAGAIWYVVVAVIAAIAVVALTPDVTIPDTGRDQQSGTNRLGDSTNEPRINQRIDDIFGTVNKHVPSLWQVPYRIGVNNQETEVLLCCVGRGRYQIDPNKWYDGDTPVVNIPNAAVNIYEPGKNISSDTPDTVIGYEIDEKIGIYRQSNDLNPVELEPPNARENAGIKWRLSGSGGDAVMVADFIPDGFDFTEFYKVGDKVKLSDMYYTNRIGEVDLYSYGVITQSSLTATNPDAINASNTQNIAVIVPNQTINVTIPAGSISVTDGTNTYTNTTDVTGSGDYNNTVANGNNNITTTINAEGLSVTGSTEDTYSGRTFDTYSRPVDLGYGGNIEYTIISVTSNTLTLSIPVGAPSDIVNAWSSMSSYYPPTFYAYVSNATIGDVYVINPLIQNGEWFFYESETVYPASVDSNNLNPITGAFFDNVVGPLFLPSGTSEVIINLTSSNGFYKLDENSEVAITASGVVKFYELDGSGNETGLNTSSFFTYSSNPDSVTQSVFQTLRLISPYENCKITVERISNRDKGKNISNVDKIEFRDLYTFEPAGGVLENSFTGGMYVFDDLSYVYDVTQDVMDSLNLNLGTVDAGRVLRVQVPSQSFDQYLSIISITEYGTNGNFNIRFAISYPGGFNDGNTTVILSDDNITGIDFGDVTLAQVVIPSNSTSRLVKQRKQNVDLTRKITQYLGNGNFGPVESYTTDQFDQILIHMALDPRNGRLSIDNINADGYMDIRDEMVSYFGDDSMCKFGYDFDTVEMTFQDMYMLVANAVMCTPYVQAGVYDLFFEKQQSVSTMQVTCRNKVINSEVRKTDFDKENDGVEVTYRDNTTGAQETVYIPSDQSATNPKTIELSGVTTRLQAFRRAWREYNKIKYEIKYIQFEVDEFGRNIIPNKRIDSPDSTRFTKREGVTDGYRVYDGEVVEVTGFNVELSEPVEFIDGEDHYITFTKADGSNSESILCTQIDNFNVLLSVMPSEPIYDGYEKDRTKYILVSEQLKESVALIPKTIEFNLSEDNIETHSVKLVNYTDKYYQNDLDTLE